MSEYDNNMTGVMFQNNKGGNESRPDIRGECTIDGKDYAFVGWHRVSKKGNNYYSLKFEVAGEKKDAAPLFPEPQENDQPALDDGIPH